MRSRSLRGQTLPCSAAPSPTGASERRAVPVCARALSSALCLQRARAIGIVRPTHLASGGADCPRKRSVSQSRVREQQSTAASRCVMTFVHHRSTRTSQTLGTSQLSAPVSQPGPSSGTSLSLGQSLRGSMDVAVPQFALGATPSSSWAGWNSTGGTSLYSSRNSQQGESKVAASAVAQTPVR